MFRPYSKRHQPQKLELTYKLSIEVRNRLLYAIQDLIDPNSKPGKVHEFSGFRVFLDEVEGRLRHQYGGLITGNESRLEHVTGFPVLDFFLDCTEERALDFIEFFFRSETSRFQQRCVDRINDILREEGIGYEFSPIVTHTEETDPPPHYPSGTKSSQFFVDSFPQALKKTNELVHQEVVMPALQLLAGEEWKSSNEHMLKAHELYRKGENRSAITECNAALESALKTICQKKKWKYTPDRDVLSGLIEVLNQKGLIYPFYVEVLKNCGTIRNKLGAHGQEPKPTFTTEASHAEHMIHLVSSHVLFLARLAGMR